ncbi:MAG: hypothetical protein Q4C34_09015 [Bacteroidales bacterium]|nr:hypothetical protein [Bacteroidales bacterium]
MKRFYTLIALAVAGCACASAAAPRKAPHRAAISETPVTVKEATDVHRNGFTANWEAFANPWTNNYCIGVYEPIEITVDDTYEVLSESFDLQPLGTTVEPFEAEDFAIYLDDYDWTDTPDWSVIYPILARGMVNGIVYSPYVDLTNNGGKYTVVLGVVGYQGAQVHLTAFGSTEDERIVTLATTGYNNIELEFDNGVHDTYFSYVDFGILDDPDQLYASCWDFLDDFAITQSLKAGDTLLRPLACAETEPDAAVPPTSYVFERLKYLNGASKVAYDVQANIVYYDDPSDPYSDYEIERSAYSPLMHVDLAAAGIADVAADTDTTVRYYNLQGIEMQGTPTGGIYIRRQGDKTTKVVL